ncbi:MAG: NAD(+)/NADH kinase [Oscillospiraceae bacterium]|nr:NAD(+)/NADH kinase [Oscillospiraceae bacterium]
MKVVLSPNPYRDKGLKAVQAADRILRNVGVETVFCLPFAMEESYPDNIRHLDFKEIHKELPQADMLVCFGGDGTILHAAKDANTCGVPILGVNLGSMGFMAELEQSELPLLSKIAAGKYTTESRMMLDVAVRRDGRIIFRDIALNDAAVTKGAIARIIDLEVLSDKTLTNKISGDGVIVSTPTGSTGYSMAAGGPIVEPTARNILVTPICAHILNARPMVLGRDRVVTVKTAVNTRKTGVLSVDGGRAFKLNGGDAVEIRRSRASTKLVKITDRTFYEVLRVKLGGGGVS